MSKRKTEGLEWLELSMVSFNGSGYADKHDANAYAESYKAYKRWKRDKYALELIDRYPTVPYGFAVEQVHLQDAGHTPNEKRLNQFKEYYDYDKHKQIFEGDELESHSLF